MSAVPSTPSTPGRASAIASRSSSSAPVGHRQRVVAGAQRAACRVVGGDQHQPAGRRRSAPSGRRRAAAQLGDPARAARTRVLDQVGHDVRRSRVTPPWSIASSSAVVGIASAHASRPATTAPAALAKRRIRSRSQPGQQPVAQRAAEGVAGAQAVDDVDRHRRHHDRLVAAHAEHPAGPCLTTPGRRRRRAARRRPRSGSRSPIATSHSSRLPTATSACSTRGPDVRVRRLGGAPEHRPVVEVEHGHAVRRRAPPAPPWSPSATAPGDRPVPVTQKMSAARDRLEVELVGPDLEVGRRREPVEVQREVVGREDLAERHRRRQVRHGA